MRLISALVVTSAFIGAMTIAGVSAQGGRGGRSGNPTPGTSQPDPPRYADRVTVIGCLQALNPDTVAKPDSTTPSDARFVLTNATREDRVPAGTGISALAAAAAAANSRYRVKGLDSQLAPFAGMRVEMSGQIEPSPPGASGAPAGGPVLQVEFVQKLAATCAATGR